MLKKYFAVRHPFVIVLNATAFYNERQEREQRSCTMVKADRHEKCLEGVSIRNANHSFINIHPLIKGYVTVVAFEFSNTNKKITQSSLFSFSAIHIALNYL